MSESIVSVGPIVPEHKLQLLRDTYAKGASPQEFELFVAVANRLRLDPFARQIYAVKRYDAQLKREVMQAQVSIDGMRLTAERTGQYAGQAAPQWCGLDGQWVDVWLSDEPPRAARVAVYRRDFAHPMTAVALFDEYAQYKGGGELTRFWSTMPANQLAKCAEALALRKAFPNELSGVYTVDEMAQADSEPAPKLPASGVPPAANDNATPKAQPPRFHAAWSSTQWAGKPLEGAPHGVLVEYLEALDRVLADNRRRKLHPELKLARTQAEAVYDRLVVKQLDAAQEQPDPIAAALDAELEREHLQREDEPQLALDGDGNDAWGMPK